MKAADTLVDLAEAVSLGGARTRLVSAYAEFYKQALPAGRVDYGGFDFCTHPETLALDAIWTNALGDVVELVADDFTLAVGQESLTSSGVVTVNGEPYHCRLDVNGSLRHGFAFVFTAGEGKRWAFGTAGDAEE